MKKMFRMMALVAIIAVIVSVTAIAMEEETDHYEHYAACTAPTVCAVGGEAYDGSDIRHGNAIYEDRGDASAHWQVCEDCGEELGGPYGHIAKSCRIEHRETCRDCDGTYPDMLYYHNSYFVDCEYRDARIHTVTCAYCKDSWSENHYGSDGYCSGCGEAYEDEEKEHDNHYAVCTNPTVCAVGGEEYTGDDVRHGSEKATDLGDAQYHWSICVKCGEKMSDSFPHEASCNNPDVCQYCGGQYAGMDYSHAFGEVEIDDKTHSWTCDNCGESWTEAHYASCNRKGVCFTCGAQYQGMDYAHPYDAIVIKTNDAKTHTIMCTECGEAWNEEHFTREDDFAGYCSVCGAAYSSAGTDESTATEKPAATAAPTATEEPAATVAPTAKPASGTTTSTTSKSTVSETVAEDSPYINMAGDDLLKALCDELGIQWNADEAPLTAECVTIALDEGDDVYGGSTLTVYPAADEGKTLGARLSSAYDAETALSFDAWRKAITDVELLRGSEDYAEFVAMARQILKTLLPEESDDQIDELLVSILQSMTDAETANEERWPSIFEYDEADELYGELEYAGYAFRLLRREESIVLDICKAL